MSGRKGLIQEIPRRSLCQVLAAPDRSPGRRLVSTAAAVALALSSQLPALAQQGTVTGRVVEQLMRDVLRAPVHPEPETIGELRYVPPTRLLHFLRWRTP